MLRFVHLTLQQFSSAHLLALFCGFFLAVGLVVAYELWQLLGSGRRWRARKNALVAALLVLYALAVADIVLLGRGEERSARVALVPFLALTDAQQRGKFLVYDALNAALFVPLTFLVSSLEFGRPRRRRSGRPAFPGERMSLPVAVATSALIEVTQLLFGVGTFETEDFICNMLGALVGLGLHRAWTHVRYAPTRKGAARPDAKPGTPTRSTTPALPRPEGATRSDAGPGTLPHARPPRHLRESRLP